MPLQIPILEPDTFASQIAGAVTIVDLRDAVPFGLGHLTGSVHVKAKSPDFLLRMERFTPEGKAIVLITDDLNLAVEAAAELKNVRTVTGAILANDLNHIQDPLAQFAALTPRELHDMRQSNGALLVLDVREPAEWKEGSAPDVIKIAMNDVIDQIDRLPKDKPIAITCAGGQRSSLIGSILLNRGYSNIYNVTGGMKAWVAAGLPWAQ